MKRCPLCDETKPASEFYLDRRSVGGLHTYCKSCCKVRAKRRYAADPHYSYRMHREWVAKNPDRVKLHKAKHAYGISAAEYDALQQVCVICGAVDHLVIDHSHQSGRIRGMLCGCCNKGLGFFRDNPSLLYRAADYLIGDAKPDIFAATYEPVE